MRWALILTALLLASPALAQPQCAWNPDIVSDTFQYDPQTGPFPTIEDGTCIDVSPLSVVWLQNDGCACSVDARIVATFQACDGQPATTCDTYDFGYSIAGVAAGSGANMIGERLTGQANPQNPPPVIFFDQEMDIPCGGLMVFDFSVECSCTRTVNVPLTAITTNQWGQLVRVITAVVQAQVVCTSEDTLARFSALCTMECDPADPPPAIPIEHTDP